MASKLGPRIVTDNLVLALDCADAKSYPGEPTTNNLDSSDRANANTAPNANSNYGTITATKEVVNYSSDRPHVYRFKSTNATGYLSWGYNSTIQNQSGSVYTFSFDYKIIRADAGTGTALGTGSFLVYGNGYKLPDASSIASNISSSEVELSDGWKRVTKTYTCGYTGYNQTRQDLSTNDLGDFEVLIDNIQFEDKTYSTPFVYSSRSAITSLLIHGNVGSGSSFEDSSPNKFTVTNTGLSGNLVTRNSSVVKFGSESLNFGSSGTRYLEISDDDEFHFNTSDFTIEAWIYPLNFGDYRGIYHQGESSGNYYMNSLELKSTGALRWLIRNSGTTVLDINTNASTLTANTWQHIAATREGNYFKLWINGVLSKTSASISTALDNLTYDVHIGNRVIGGTPSYQYYGYMDEVRVTNGTALYTANFTPSTERFKNGAWLDISGNENNGNFINGVNTGTSHYRVGDVIYPAGTNSARYLDFDGTDQYIDLGTISSGDNLYISQGSIELWFKYSASQNGVILGWGDASTNWGQLAVTNNWTGGMTNESIIIGSRKSSTDYWQFGVTDGADYYGDGNWHHIVFTKGVDNSTNITCYIDGVQKTMVVQKVGTGEFFLDNVASSQINVGRRVLSADNAYYDGQVASIKIYSDILTQAEALQNYNSTKSRFS